jgi:hypothetical protein
MVNIESTVSAFKGVRSGWRPLPRVGDVAIGSK